MKLNCEQREAIEYKGGPLLIIAGAGTGKTTVVTERIKHLITSGQASPGEILALTFTEKAAREMQERIDVALPLGYSEMTIGTFHSFCDRVLRDEALAMGWDPRFKLMTGANVIQFVRKNLFEFDLDYYRPLGNPTKYVEAILTHFSRLADENVVSSEYTAWANDQLTKSSFRNEEEELETIKWNELAKTYQKYEELKIKNSVFDFSDLITKTLELFGKRPNILAQYQKKYKYVLVDEYQDVNFAQSKLAILLAGEKVDAKITVCGDDDQSIYRFRGAAISNIVGFRKIYPNAKIVVLTRNYRSTQTILDGAYRLITNNNPDRLEVVEKINKRLVNNKKVGGEKAQLLHTKDLNGEAEKVVDKIISLNKKYEYGEMAILVRANNHGEAFGRELTRRGVPWQFLGPGKLFSQPEIIDLVSYLKVLADPEDSLSFYRLLSMEGLEIDNRDLIKLSKYAKRMSTSIQETLSEIEEVGCSENGTERIKKVMKIIGKHLKLTHKESAGQLLYWFLEETGVLSKFMKVEDVEALEKAKNVAKFFEKVRAYENENVEARVGEVVDWIELANELGESPLVSNEDWTENNAVNILTVHSSKGLEFPVVFMVNLVVSRFPSMERREAIPIPEALVKETLPTGDFHMQEERRLFYVGMTRAKECLYFSAADFYGEGIRSKKISPFVEEALGEVRVDIKDGPGEIARKLASHGVLKKKLKIGEKLEHKVDYLSYSQIEAFRTCPTHYKLRYILGLPMMPSAPLSFGVSVHETMKELYKLGRKMESGIIEETLGRCWVRQGYKSKAHQEKAREKALNFVKKYFEDEYNPKIETIALEEGFNVWLPERKSERRLKVGGKIDRIDGTKEGVEIIDYKTGANVPTQREVDHDLQLTIYALAATQLVGEPFGRKPEEIKLTLYYFDGQKKLTTKRTQKQLDEAVNEIYEIRREIEESDFKCSGSYYCRNCEYRMFCV